MTTTHEQLTVEHVSIDSVTPSKKNARAHDEHNIADVAASLKAFGQRKPIVVYNGEILAGNGTWLAAKSLGWDTITITRCDHMTRANAIAYGIADNRTSETSKWDEPVLAELLAEVASASEEVMFEATGFSQKEFDCIVQKTQSIDDANSDDASEDFISRYEVCVSCSSEADQQDVFTRMQAEGRRCRVLTL